jgi:hypothetical protein
MPSGSTGKADAFTTIRGSDIPSAFADPNKSYMISRRIANLSAVGAMDMVQGDLAKRIDGIIANIPADGMLHLAELVRMENPTINGSLFPAEKQALPKLWKLVEAPDANDVVFGPKDNFGVLDGSTPPAAAIPPAQVAIATLAPELQSPATRLENLYNNDGNATTVSLTDLASGIANPAPFTPAEQGAFATTQAVIRDKAVATAEVKLVVSPGPAPFIKDATLGPTTFHMTGATKFDEQRQLFSTQMTSTLTATQSLSATVAMPANAQVLVLAEDSAAETVFPAGAVPGLPGGDYLFEVWQGGTRTFSTNARLPVMTSQKTIALNDKLDYPLVAGLAPLVRNLNTATANGAGVYMTHYTFDTAVIPPPANVVQQAVTATASPTITIPVGRYTLTQGAILYVYSNNVMWFSWGNTQYRLLPAGNNGAAVTRLFVQNPAITFDTITNTLTCNQCSLSVRLQGSMRDI